MSVEKLYNVRDVSRYKLSPPAGPSSSDSPWFHHANGYLVAFNDPVQSRNSAAALLRDLPASRRIPFLTSIPGVRQLLREHGTQTIQDKLNEELSGLRDASRKASSLDRTLSTPPDRGVPLELVQNRYQTYTSDSNSLPEGYELPNLEVIDGRLIVDGEVQLNIATDRLPRAFRWTRPLAQRSLWEHGFLKVYPHGAGGTGVTYLTTSQNPESVTTNGRLCRFLARAVDPVPTGRPRRSNWGSFTSTSKYMMKFDREIWPADQPDWGAVKDKVAGGGARDGLHRDRGRVSSSHSADTDPRRPPGADQPKVRQES